MFCVFRFQRSYFNFIFCVPSQLSYSSYPFVRVAGAHHTVNARATSLSDASSSSSTSQTPEVDHQVTANRGRTAFEFAFRIPDYLHHQAYIKAVVSYDFIIGQMRMDLNHQMEGGQSMDLWQQGHGVCICIWLFSLSLSLSLSVSMYLSIYSDMLCVCVCLCVRMYMGVCVSIGSNLQLVPISRVLCLFICAPHSVLLCVFSFPTRRLLIFLFLSSSDNGGIRIILDVH